MVVAVANTSTSSDSALLVTPSGMAECWDGEDVAVLVCRRVVEITHDVKTFHFEAEDGRVFTYEPGQFITLELQIDGVNVSRCYTISSPPTRPHLISITVKRVLGGEVSNWLHDTMEPGTRVTVQAPLGAFTLTGPPRPKYLFLSAGSGITPLMSMTRTLFDLATDTDVVFLHSARTPADIIFRRELEAIAAVTPAIRVVHVCEGDYPSERWMGLKGRITAGMLEAVVPDLHEREVFTCGPEAYMASVRRILEDVGHDRDRYHEESFSFDLLPPAQQPVEVDDDLAEASGGDAGETAAVEVETFQVEFVKSGVTFPCASDQNVLDAAFAAGLRPPSSCSQGMCGTCKSTMLTGEVDMQHNGGIRPREVAQNKVLICCSKPRSDLRIDN